MLHHSVLLFTNDTDAVIILIVADPGRECISLRRFGHLTFAGQVTNLSGESRHEGISLGVV